MSDNSEFFRNELITKLESTLPPEQLRAVLNAFDSVAASYEITRQKTDLITTDGFPEPVKWFLTSKDIPVIIMEPLQGGKLATLTPAAVEVLKKADPKASAASWAFRYLAGLPNVLCILSGMTLPEHVEDNIRTFSPVRPLSESDKKALNEALAVYRKQLRFLRNPGLKYLWFLPCR